MGESAFRRWMMTDLEKLPEHEAKAMLAKLTEHYGEPVMPIHRYCRALSTWVQVRAKAPGKRGYEAKHLHHILTDVLKSSLLYRLIYVGEPLRTAPCPEHKGVWSGLGTCVHGCDLTGWLPEDGSPTGHEVSPVKHVTLRFPEVDDE